MDLPSLLVLRSTRLARLEALLVASGAAAGRVRGVDDAAELLAPGSRGGTILYDADDVPVEDLGILGRAQRGGSVLVGFRAAGPISPAPIGGGGGFRPDAELEWPVDVDTLARLAGRGESDARGVLRSPAGSAPIRPPSEPPGGSSRSGRNGPGPAPHADLGAIEEILRGVDAADGRALQRMRGADAVGPRREGPPKIPHRPPAANGRPRLQPQLPVPSPGPGGSSRGGANTPRTAFLRTRIQPARRAPLGASGPSQAATAAPADPDVEEGALARAFEGDGPLLSEAELEAFFGAAPAAPPVGGGTAQEAPSLAPERLSFTQESTSREPEPPPSDPAAASTAVAGQRPPWLRAQVADLADIVQALDLRARASHAHAVLGDDLARLRQFTRTIGFVAAPPAGDAQDLDLAAFVEEQLGEAAGVEPDAPRLLFRRIGSGAPRVIADKALVALSIDALLQTALACAGSGDVVRVSVTAEGGAGGAPVTARIDFPRGPLAGLPPADLLDPYALRAKLPMIGPNALAAAGGIAVGQGGDLLVEEAEGERLAFVLDLPAAE